MAKGIFVAFMCLFILSACSAKPESLIEAMDMEGIKVVELQEITDSSIVNGIKPVKYKLDNTIDNIMVYDFSSNEARELGLQQFQEHQQILSSHAPIVYKPQNYLILYYSDANSKKQTPDLAETKYGKKLQKAYNRLE